VHVRRKFILSSLIVLLGTGPAAAHDPLTAKSPGQNVEAKVAELRQKMDAAKAAGVPAEALESARFVYLAGTAWPNRVITVCFWNGTKALQDYVMSYANDWTKYGAIKFSYQTNGHNNICTDANSANIRVSLDAKDPRDLYINEEDSRTGDWSYPGDLDLDDYLVTLNLADVAKEMHDDPHWTHHAIRHEFGHALGLMHEHQRKECAGWFNFKQIAKDTGWTIEQAKSQVGAFPDSDLAGLGFVGPYDKKSIMQYNFAKTWLLKRRGLSNPCIRPNIETLSDKDQAGIAALYPPLMATTHPGLRMAGAAGQEGPSLSERIATERDKLKQIQANLQARALQRSGVDHRSGQQAAALGDVISALDELAGARHAGATTMLSPTSR
jgi:hypothetical protein